MKCYTKCQKEKKCCQVKECRLWMDYPQDLNCVEITVQKEGSLTLTKIGDRLKLTASRVKQIENKALARVSKTHPQLRDELSDEE